MKKYMLLLSVTVTFFTGELTFANDTNYLKLSNNSIRLEKERVPDDNNGKILTFCPEYDIYCRIILGGI